MANRYLMKDLIQAGVWNEKIKNNIIANHGSVQQLDMIPPEIREKYLSVGMEVLGQSPELFAAAIKREIAVIGKVVKSAGIRED